MGKFRCTITVDLDMPKEKDEDTIRPLLATFVTANLANLADQKISIMLIDDVKFVACKVKKIKETANA